MSRLDQRLPEERRRTMHHKRGRPRSRRAGCKMCKHWKINGWRTERVDGEKFTDHQRRVSADEAIHDVLKTKKGKKDG